MGCKKRQGSPESLATEKDKIEAFEEGDDEDENEKVAIPLVDKTTKNDTQTGDQQKNGTAKTNHNQVLMHGVWKPQKKSHSTLRAKRVTFTFWVDKS